MGVVAGARIDDGDFALADDIGAGAVEGERRGVWRDEAAHERGKAGQRARRGLTRIGEEIGFRLVSLSRSLPPGRRSTLGVLDWTAKGERRSPVF